MDLRVAVIKARSAQPRSDPIFYLAGGPGGSAIEWASYAMGLLGSANEQRDVIFVDLRGTGGSNKLVCPQPIDPALQVEALRSCMADLDGDPRAYTTAWAMDDVDDVRAALSYDQINLYGGSYGTAAAQIYILRHGEHVRTAALDGATLLEVPILERWPITSQKALELVFDRCKADATCHSAFPNLRQEFTEVLARLDRAPVTMPINNPVSGQPFVLTAEVFKTSIHGALASTSTAVLVPRYIHLVYTEDWNRLAAFLAPFLNTESSGPTWQIMNLTILCYEDWAKMRPAEIAETSAGSYLKYDDVRALTVPEDICAEMPRPRPEALYGPLTNSSVPVLFFNGEADPQDPPENVADANQRYPNSLILIAPGQAHGFTGIPCRDSIVADFIEHGLVDGLSTQCLEQVALPTFEK
ncbi:MAG: alpha/beta fold hydrolase [Chloroflexi bacterium]|nr:MAG: alpha/beta fold hydrolase [Chloroflexota bacterium]